jgi:pimeloyl-ACP methyl ester carboxylesterase
MHASRTEPRKRTELTLDTSISVPGGRSLTYTDLGASSGPVVIYLHGAPSSRLDLVLFEDALAALGVRVVSADRPGYGGSSPIVGRRLEDWPAEMAALADHLGVERFAVMGASSGGPYAIACAALLPDRVASAGVVCGVTDFGWTGAWDGYPEHESELMRIGEEAQAVAWCKARYGQDGSRFMEGGLGELVAADQAVLADEAFASALMITMGEAFRQGVGGYAQDIVVQGRPWSFDAGAIGAPVWVLHGEADTLVPVTHARHRARIVPSARLVTGAGQGHLSILPEIPQLAAELVAVLR